MWNKMTVMQEKEGVERQNSNKGFEKNEPARIVERFSVFLDSTACPYLKLAGPSSSRPTRKNQSSSKLRLFRKRKQKSQLGLTGMGNVEVMASDYKRHKEIWITCLLQRPFPMYSIASYNLAKACSRPDHLLVWVTVWLFRGDSGDTSFERDQEAAGERSCIRFAHSQLWNVYWTAATVKVESRLQPPQFVPSLNC